MWSSRKKQRLVIASLVVFSLLLMVTLSMCSLDKKLKLNMNTIRAVILSFCWLGILSILLVFLNFSSKYNTHHDPLTSKDENKSQENPEGNIQPPDMAELLLEEYSLPAAIFIFGGGAIVLRMFYLMSDIQCSFYVDDNRFTMQIFFNISVLFLFALQLPFLTKLHKIKSLKTKFFAHHLVLIIASADIVTWAHSFFRNINIFDGLTENKHTNSEGLNVSMACQNFTSVMDLYSLGTAEKMLLPFTMEFLLASLEILFHVWMLPVVVQGIKDDSEEVQSPSVSSVSTEGGYQQTAQVDRSAERQTKAEEQEDIRRDGDDDNDNQRERHDNNDNKTSCEEQLDTFDGVATSLSEMSTSSYFHEDLPSELLIGSNNENYDHNGQYKILEAKWYHSLYDNFMSGTFNIQTGLIAGVLIICIGQFYTLNFQVYQERDIAEVLNMYYSENLFTLPGYTSSEYMSEEEITLTVAIPTYCLRLFVEISMLLCTLHCFIIITSTQQMRAHQGRFYGANTILVFCCLSSCLLFVGSALIICLDDLFFQSGMRAVFFLELVEAFVAPLQYVTQALLIFMSQRRHPCRNHRYFSSLQNCLSFLAVLNLMLWIENTFVEGDLLSMKSKSRDEHWEVAVKFLVPLCIYYRYVCAFLLVRVKRRVWRSDPDVHLETNKH